MEQLVKQIQKQLEIFNQESEKFLIGNKAAGARARKATLTTEKLFKQFRKESVAK